MASIVYIEDRRPNDPRSILIDPACLPDDLVLTGVLYRVEDGVYLFRAGSHHKGKDGRRRVTAEPYRHEVMQGVYDPSPECRLVRAFIAWFDDRVTDWNHALRDGMALYPAIGKTLAEWRPGGGAKIFPGPGEAFRAVSERSAPSVSADDP